VALWFVDQKFRRDPQLALHGASVMSDPDNAPVSRAELRRQKKVILREKQNNANRRKGVHRVPLSLQAEEDLHPCLGHSPVFDRVLQRTSVAAADLNLLTQLTKRRGETKPGSCFPPHTRTNTC
jgi:hypothetical protein